MTRRQGTLGFTEVYRGTDSTEELSSLQLQGHGGLLNPQTV